MESCFFFLSFFLKGKVTFFQQVKKFPNSLLTVDDHVTAGNLYEKDKTIYFKFFGSINIIINYSLLNITNNSISYDCELVISSFLFFFLLTFSYRCMVEKKFFWRQIFEMILMDLRVLRLIVFENHIFSLFSACLSILSINPKQIIIGTPNYWSTFSSCGDVS